MCAAVGVYFDISVNSTSSLYISLHNAPSKESSISTGSPVVSPGTNPTTSPEHLSFHSSALLTKQAVPISLLARVDQEEYILLPNSSSLVTIRVGDLDRHVLHDVRIIAPMVDDQGNGVIQFKGLWLDKGGKLLRVEGSQLEEEIEEEDSFHAESDSIGRKHRLGLGRLLSGGIPSTAKSSEQERKGEDLEDRGGHAGKRKRILEIITDTPGLLGRQSAGKRSGGGDGLLGGVMGWEYLIGEMFGVDHVNIGLDGMCLTQNCIGGTGYPAGIGDVFFRR